MNDRYPLATGVFPASFAQERLWFLEQFEPDVTLQGINARFPLPGRIDPGRLESALAAVVARHEVLRTSLVVEDGALTQVVWAEAPVALARTDLSALPDDRRWDEFMTIGTADARAPFALDEPPLWRARLVRMADDDWWLLFVVHHTVFDASSAGIFLSELLEVYSAGEEGRAPKLADLAIQYADYAVWLRGRWTAGELDGQLAYWRDRLEGAPAELGLPTDRPRPAVPSYGGDTLEVELPTDLAEGLTSLAHQSRATLFMTLLSGLSAVLSRYAGVQEVVVGSLVGGRDVVETEPLVGMFVNTLNLRVDVSGDPTFRELLGRVRGVALEALDHAEVPFEKLVEALQPDRHLSRAPLHQVVLNLLPPGAQPPFSNGTAKVDLFIDAALTDGGRLELRVDYSTDLFEAATVGRMVSSLEMLLATAVADPDRPLSCLGLLVDGDRAVVADANRTTRPYPDQCLHDLVAAQAVRTPEALAVVHPDGHRVTYRELERWAAAVAGRLQSLGVGPGARVGVCLERSAELVATLLGVVRTGAAYVPLDPEYPGERLAFMVADARVAAVVTRSALADRLPHAAAPTLLVESVRPEDAAGFRAPVVHPDELAYVIYTSGSTGRPKGVMVPHRGVVSLMCDVDRSIRLGAGDGCLWLTSMSFDIAALEVFGPLLTGGTVVAVADRAVSAAGLVRRLVDDGVVSVVQATPSVLGVLVSELPAGSLRAVISGGEPLPVGLASEVLGVAG
ncbi:MAG: non-ribosomal peptide synthetase, partial [Acidimicrobiales bacterium]